MNWGEFKEFVDEELKKLRMGDDAEIDYIDMSSSTRDLAVLSIEDEDDFCVY